MLKEFIRRCLDQNYTSLVRSVEGLSQEELSWRPGPECNSIGFLAWHYGRVLDRWILARVQGIPQLYEQGWAQKFKRDPDPNDAGFGFTAEQLEAFETPSGALLLQYAAAARELVNDFLGGLDDGTLETRRIPNPYGGEITLSTLFQQLIWELNQHGGQMAYLRGIQRGIEEKTYTGGVLN